MTEVLQGTAPESLGGFREPGFDMEEINLPSSLEIHLVDSRGVISWNFMGDQPDFPFCEWNFGTTTAEDHAWLCKPIEAEGKHIHVADFAEQGARNRRIVEGVVSGIEVTRGPSCQQG